MNHTKRPSVTLLLATILTTWIVLLGLNAYKLSVKTDTKIPTPTLVIPENVECWRIEGREYDEKYRHYTPAHIIEFPIIDGMRGHRARSLLCMGDIGGVFVSWTAIQPWVDRGVVVGKGTGHK